MRILGFRPINPDVYRPKVIAIWGLGLIGRAIYKVLRSFNLTEKEYSFLWQGEKGQILSAELIRQAIHRKVLAVSDPKTPDIVFIWSAGHKGFSATQEDIEMEMTTFNIILGLAEQLRNDLNGIQVEFHLISSAGGLFEGCQYVEEETLPCPCRPYGYLKLEQERALLNTAGLIPYIYRPSSVYGLFRGTERRSLLAVLVYQGLLRQVIQVSGALTTLRDYIHVRDVAQYLAGKVVFSDPARDSSGIFWLISGKPVSIFEAKQLVERVLRHRLYLALQHDPENRRNITFAPSLCPPAFASTALHTGVSLIYQGWLASGAQD